jgi:hypothetical protein
MLHALSTLQFFALGNWIGGGKGGGNTRAHQKKDFGEIPYFLEITYVGEAYLIFEKSSVFPKVRLLK